MIRARSLALGAALLTVAATTSLRAQGPEAPPSYGHAIHAKVFEEADRSFEDACADCHPNGVDADEERPGLDDHRDCSGCHASAFFGAAGEGPEAEEVCRVCHLTSKYIGENPLHPFPFHHEDEGAQARCRSRDTSEYYVEFSHRAHVSLAGDGKGKALCLGCHQVEADTGARPHPTHDECVECHHEEAEETFSLSECRGCHQLRRRDDGRDRPQAPARCDHPSRVIRFDHATHRLDRRQGRSEAPVDCAVCHAKVARARTVAEIEPKRTSRQGRFQLMIDACGKCHRAGQRQASGAPMARVSGSCVYCHDEGALFGGNQRAPASHRRR